MIHPPSDAVRLYLHQLRQEELEAEATRMRLARQVAAPSALARFAATVHGLLPRFGERAGVAGPPAVAPRVSLWWRIALIASRR